MKKRLLRVLILLVLVGAGVAIWFFYFRKPPANHHILLLYGNVDTRQVDLAFNNSERINTEVVQEGDHVHVGELLATLDTSRLKPALQQAVAQLAAQQQVVDRLKAGSRPQEIAAAHAQLLAADADAVNAKTLYDRYRKLLHTGDVTSQKVDDAAAALKVAHYKMIAAQKSWRLAVLGPRIEDVRQAQAQFKGDQANVALAQQRLADAKLFSPVEGIVRERLLEPGDMASPAAPVFSIAIENPKWVRAYVAEPDLGRIRLGQQATIEVDSFPHHAFKGWIGFISPTAEFTPKTVETTVLRTDLVYQVRVFVHDPHDQLRLGMPATVVLHLNKFVSGAAASQPQIKPGDTQP
ncbi:MAG: HlyD family efflux transporter periplasmic adaptor subunit [Phycisphaerales bacterium]|nr:HlyD family efflux transporter periplasmic adaptor subunit [Phycisphaerales bacterium]